jgi:hypothetical protein
LAPVNKVSKPTMRRKNLAIDNRDVSPGQGKSGRSTEDTLDTTVLGVCTGTGLGYLDYALVRFSQSSPSDSLRVKLQQVSSYTALRSRVFEATHHGHSSIASPSPHHLETPLSAISAMGAAGLTSHHTSMSSWVGCIPVVYILSVGNMGLTSLPSTS